MVDRSGFVGLTAEQVNLITRHKTQVTKDMTEKDIMKVWIDEYDVGAPNRGGYTDAKWRAECEQRSMNLKTKAKEIMKANQRQVGGDHYKEMGVERDQRGF